jgi:hypothetical protein
VVRRRPWSAAGADASTSPPRRHASLIAVEDNGVARSVFALATVVLVAVRGVALLRHRTRLELATVDEPQLVAM